MLCCEAEWYRPLSDDFTYHLCGFQLHSELLFQCLGPMYRKYTFSIMRNISYYVIFKYDFEAAGVLCFHCCINRDVISVGSFLWEKMLSQHNMILDINAVCCAWRLLS